MNCAPHAFHSSLTLPPNVHGSGPDIAGKGITNPLAVIPGAALMLHTLGYGATRIELAVDQVFREGQYFTPDLGGSVTTIEVIKRI